MLSPKGENVSRSGRTRPSVSFEEVMEPAEVAMEAPPGGLVLGARTPVRPPEIYPRMRVSGILSGLRDAGPVALAGFAANGANVVVTVLVARLLDTRGYGSLAQLTSLFLIVSMPGTAVAVGVVRRVTVMAASGRGGSVCRWASRVQSRAVGVVVVLAGLALFTRGPFARLLSIPAPFGVFAILFAGFVWVFLSFDRGLLQAHRRYRTLAVNLLIEGGVRTAVVMCLVGAGLGVAGAASGILLAEILTAVHARVAGNRVWSEDPRGAAVSATSGVGVDRVVHDARTKVSDRERLLLVDVSAALVAMALLAFLQNVDVIVLGREAPHSTGAYAAISVASKALVFGAVALGGYLLPEAAIAWHRGGHALRQLGVTMLVLAVPGSVLLFGAAVFPRRMLSLVFSARYVSAHSAFWLLVVAMIFLSTTAVLTIYLLAAGQRWIGGLLLAGAVVGTLALSAAHGAPRPTAAADLEVQGGLALVTAVAFARIHTKRAAALPSR